MTPNLSSLKFDLLLNTLDRLHTMQEAATPIILPIKYSFMNRIFHLLCPQPVVPKPRQEILKDARELADTFAEFAASWTLGKPETDAQYNACRRKLAEHEKTYSGFDDRSATGASSYYATEALYKRLESLHKEPEEILQWDLMENNRLGVDGIAELLRCKTAIVAPLSADYLMLSTYRNYIRETMKQIIPIYPVLLTCEDAEPIIVPEGFHSGLEKAQKVAIYTDATESGSTGQALYEALRPLCGDRLQAPDTTWCTSEDEKGLEKGWADYCGVLNRSTPVYRLGRGRSRDPEASAR